MIDVIADRIVRKNPFLRDWSNYGIIDVFNPVSVAQYQHSVTIPNKPGMMHDFRDLRFFQPDGTEIPFWLESKTDGSTSSNWFKPYSLSQRKAYVFYGNREAVSQSNGDKTFEFFDDFLGSALDTNKWTTTGTPAITISNSNMVETGNNSSRTVNSVIAFGTNYALRSKFVVSNSPSENTYIGMFTAAATPPQIGFWGDTGYRCYTQNGGVEKDNGTLGTSTVIGDIIRNGSTNIIFKIGGSTVYTATAQVPTGNLYIGTRVWPTGHTLGLDWILVRKYTATEPVCQLNQSGLRNPAYR